MNAATIVRPAPSAALPNGLPWKPYAYRGTGDDQLTAFMDDEPDAELAPDPEVLAWPHGTITGVGRHESARERLCEACREARSEYKRRRRADVKPCGTRAAYRRHLRRGEPVDESCRQAEARAKADRKRDLSRAA